MTSYPNPKPELCGVVITLTQLSHAESATSSWLWLMILTPTWPWFGQRSKAKLYSKTFPLLSTVGDPHSPWNLALKVTHPAFEHNYFDQHSIIAPQPSQLAKKELQLLLIGSRPRAFQLAIDELCTLPLSPPKGGSKREFFIMRGLSYLCCSHLEGHFCCLKPLCPSAEVICFNNGVLAEQYAVSSTTLVVINVGWSQLRSSWH